MSFRNNRGSISVFALIVVSMIALSIGSLMISNFSVYQLSKSYHVLRERLLIKKMLFQMIEEVILSKYELSDMRPELDLGIALKKEVDSVVSKTGLVIEAFELVEDQLYESNRAFLDANVVFDIGNELLNPRISGYLSHGPYLKCGQANFFYEIHGRNYAIKATGYGVALSNFDLTRYDLPLSLAGRVGAQNRRLYTMGEDGHEVDLTSVKSDINYKNRKDVSIFSNAYEWLWKSDYLENLAKNSVNRFVLEIPYSGELEENGITVVNENEVTLDLEKINFEVVAISDPFGMGVIKFTPSIANEKPLVVICHNNLKSNKKTILEIDKSIKRAVAFFVLNTEILFQNDPQVNGAFFLDPNSQARGGVTLDGHFSYYGGADFLDVLQLKFKRTGAMKAKLASIVPHVFLTDVSLMEGK